jgi:hypothetical protein
VNRHVEKADAAQTQLTRTVQAPDGSYSLGGLPPATYRIDIT